MPKDSQPDPKSVRKGKSQWSKILDQIKSEQKRKEKICQA